MANGQVMERWEKQRSEVVIFLISIIYIFIFFCGGLQGWRVDMEKLENELDWGPWCEIPQESLKNYLKNH